MRSGCVLICDIRVHSGLRNAEAIAIVMQWPLRQSRMGFPLRSAELAEKIVEDRFPSFVEKIRAEMPRYVEAPETVLRELFETGVPEWWR